MAPSAINSETTLKFSQDYIGIGPNGTGPNDEPIRKRHFVGHKFVHRKRRQFYYDNLK